MPPKTSDFMIISSDEENTQTSEDVEIIKESGPVVLPQESSDKMWIDDPAS